MLPQQWAGIGISILGLGVAALIQGFKSSSPDAFGTSAMNIASILIPIAAFALGLGVFNIP